MPVGEAGQRPHFLPPALPDDRGQAAHQRGDDQGDHGGNDQGRQGGDGLQCVEGRGNDQGKGGEVDQRAQAGCWGHLHFLLDLHLMLLLLYVQLIFLLYLKDLLKLFSLLVDDVKLVGQLGMGENDKKESELFHKRLKSMQRSVNDYMMVVGINME